MRTKYEEGAEESSHIWYRLLEIIGIRMRGGQCMEENDEVLRCALGAVKEKIVQLLAQSTLVSWET